MPRGPVGPAAPSVRQTFRGCFFAARSPLESESVSRSSFSFNGVSEALSSFNCNCNFSDTSTATATSKVKGTLRLGCLVSRSHKTLAGNSNLRHPRQRCALLDCVFREATSGGSSRVPVGCAAHRAEDAKGSYGVGLDYCAGFASAYFSDGLPCPVLPAFTASLRRSAAGAGPLSLYAATSSPVARRSAPHTPSLHHRVCL